MSSGGSIHSLQNLLLLLALSWGHHLSYNQGKQRKIMIERRKRKLLCYQVPNKHLEIVQSYGNYSLCIRYTRLLNRHSLV